MKRGGDLAVATAAGLLLAPVLLVLAVLVRASTGRPALFRQIRSGWRGEEFEILKFRTMRDERYPDEEDAARITRIGRIMRATSLDELPQLWNVIRGDMSVVGPRPTLPEQVAHYSDRQRGRLDVRPGLTGWAQVRGRNSISWPERIELDLWYVEHRSTGLDLRIMFRTAAVLLHRDGITGAGGVNPGFPIPARAAEAGPEGRQAREPAEGASPASAPRLPGAASAPAAAQATVPVRVPAQVQVQIQGAVPAPVQAPGAGVPLPVAGAPGPGRMLVPMPRSAPAARSARSVERAEEAAT